MKKATITLLFLVTFTYLYCANFKDMARIRNISGNRYGKLTVISFYGLDKYNNALWNCKCDCGNTKIFMGSRIANDYIQHCGCVPPNFKHGESNKTKEYKTRSGMLRRCYNKNDARYYSHGARGIKVCDRWIESYENFLNDMGRAPSEKHSIDRIDNNGDYTPENCRWATIEEQANNKQRTRKVIYHGIEIPLGTLCNKLNVPIELMRGRLNNGWPIEIAVVTPKRERK